MRRDTAANWITTDPILANGEFGYETDTNRFKIGDGSTAWTSHPYWHAPGSYCELRTISVSHTGNSTRLITWTEFADTDNYFDGGTSTSEIIAPFTGFYHLIYNIFYQSTSASFLFHTTVNVNRGGSASFFNDAPMMRTSSNYQSINASECAYNSGYLELTAGDAVEIINFQFPTTRTISSSVGGLQLRFIALS